MFNKNFMLILFMLYIALVESFILENNSNLSSAITSYALGVWKYLNTTILIPTTPHS